MLGKATFSGLAITGISGVAYGLVFTGAALSVLDAGRITMGATQSPLFITSRKGWHTGVHSAPHFATPEAAGAEGAKPKRGCGCLGCLGVLLAVIAALVVLGLIMPAAGPR